MKPGARIQACIDLLDEQQRESGPADRVLSKYYRQRRYIGSKDKAAISALYYQILRQRAMLDYRLKQCKLALNNRLRCALQLRLDDVTLTRLFNGERFSPTPLQGHELDHLNHASQVSMSSAPVAAKFNFPKWLTADLTESLGPRFETELQALSQRAPMDVRVNLLRITRAELKTRLENHGLNLQKCALSPWGLRFVDKANIAELSEFQHGLFEVQDQGSQLIALLSEVEAGQRVTDFCAGAGGKTLAMAAMMQNKGVIWACDVHDRRLAQLSQRKKRANAHNIRTHVLSSERDKWVKQHAASMDVVLVDAPCSGTGTWRRSPDARWNLTQAQLTALDTLQGSILTSASRLVKPGGTLIYATCSLLGRENEAQIARFLQHNTHFSGADITLPEWFSESSKSVLHNGHTLRFLPALSDTDGFFYAALKRH